MKVPPNRNALKQNQRVRETYQLAKYMHYKGYHPFRINMVTFNYLLDLQPEAGAARYFDIIDSWCEHPSYDMYHEKVEEAPENVLMMGVFQHEPGHLKRTESFILGNYWTVVKSIEWGEKSLGKFIDIRNIPHEVELDPMIRWRIAYLSYSLKGSGKAYRARMVLKKMLPKKARALIQYARHMKRKILHNSDIKKFGRSKKKRFLDAAPRVYPDKVAILEKKMTLEDFWECAIGKVHPDDVPEYIQHQREIQWEWMD